MHVLKTGFKRQSKENLSQNTSDFSFRYHIPDNFSKFYFFPIYHHNFCGLEVMWPESEQFNLQVLACMLVLQLEVSHSCMHAHHVHSLAGLPTNEIHVQNCFQCSLQRSEFCFLFLMTSIWPNLQQIVLYWRFSPFIFHTGIIEQFEAVDFL